MTPRVSDADRLLIALDIDGTLLGEDGSLDGSVVREVRRVEEAGHLVMPSTGRSVADTLPTRRSVRALPLCVVKRRHNASPVGRDRRTGGAGHAAGGVAGGEPRIADRRAALPLPYGGNVDALAPAPRRPSGASLAARADRKRGRGRLNWWAVRFAIPALSVLP